VRERKHIKGEQGGEWYGKKVDEGLACSGILMHLHNITNDVCKAWITLRCPERDCENSIVIACK
jgi:hypothetical protein